MSLGMERTDSGKYSFACNFCYGPDGNPLRVKRKNWLQHSKSTAHQTARSRNVSKRWQAIQCTPHEDTPELEGVQSDMKDAYNDSMLNKPIDDALSNDPIPHDTCPSDTLEFESPAMFDTSHNCSNDETEGITNGMRLCQVEGTGEPNPIDGEPNASLHNPEPFLESGYEHWRTVYDTDDSCDDKEYDELFTNILTASATNPNGILGNSPGVNRPRQAPLAESDAEPWYPWPSKAMFLADILFTANRLEFSRKQANAILAFARATGGKDVPTLSALTNTRDQMLEVTGNPTTRYTSDSGHIFYINEVTSALAKASN